MVILPFGAQLIPAVARGEPQLFDSMVPASPGDGVNPRHGAGRFNLEAWTLERCGLDLSRAGPSELLALQFLSDAALPFLLLLGVSLLTQPPSPTTVSQFFGRMKTPIGPTAELEAAGLAATRLDPRRFDQQKLCRASDWEFTRWDRTDATGFLLCAAFSGAILGLFWLGLRWLR